jgi:hypothetical protein
MDGYKRRLYNILLHLKVGVSHIVIKMGYAHIVII